MTFRRLLLATAGATAFATPAFAQQADEPAMRIEDVVVYGQKSDRAGLEDVEESLSIVTGATIDDEPVSDLYDVIRRTPNVVEVNGGRSFAIRGIQADGPSFSGQGQTLAVYVDDLPLNGRQSIAGPLDVWDLEQVEVYRGPQATTFGRNALAGAIYIRTGDPTFDLEAKGRVEVSEDGGRKYAAAVGGPLVDGLVAGRLSYSDERSDGFNTNTFLNSPADPRESRTLRGKLLFTPRDDIDVLVGLTSYEARRGDETITPISALPARETARDFPTEEGSDGLLGSARVRWRISDRLELTSITAFQNSNYVRLADFDGSPAPIATLDRTGEDETFSQEVRLSGDFGRLRGSVGTYYAQVDDSFFDAFQVPITILDPRLPLTNQVRREGSFLSATENMAVFVDGEYDLTDRLTLVAGARYDKEDYSTDVFQETRILGTLPPQFEFLRAIAEGIVDSELETDFDAFLPKVGLKYAIDPNATAGVTVSRGYRAGGIENNIVTGAPNTYEAEYLTNYEAWVRGRALGVVDYSLNAYYADYTNQQLPVPALAGSPGLTITRNAGESRLFGFEAEARAWLADRLSVRAGLGYADTEFTDFANPDFPTSGPADYNGNDFPFASKWTGSLGADWGGAKGLFAGATATFRSASYSDIENLPESKTDAATVIDARVGWRFERAELSAFATNLFDEDYYSRYSSAPANDFAYLGAPRVFGVRLDVSY